VVVASGGPSGPQALTPHCSYTNAQDATRATGIDDHGAVRPTSKARAKGGVRRGRVRRRYVVLLALAEAVVASCGGTQRAAASADLSAAIDRMLGLESVRVVEQATGPNTTPDVVTIDLHTPDRLHIVQTGSEAHESFQIGSALYQDEPGQPGYFRPVSLSPAQAASKDTGFGVLEAIRGHATTRAGKTYRLALPNGAGSLTAKVEGGFVTELTQDAGGVRRMQEFSRFNAAPAVVEPPADRVLPALPALPKCPPGQPPSSAFLCIN